VFDAKRLIGRKFEDPEVQADIKHYPFKVLNKGGKIYVRVQYRGEEKDFVSYSVIFLDFVIKGVKMGHVYSLRKKFHLWSSSR
jgi:hypothetical protein